MNQSWIAYILKSFNPGDKIFLVNLSKNKIDSCSLIDAVGLRVLTKQIRDLSYFNVSLSQDLALQQGASRLKRHLQISGCFQ
jgi:hypothetical protein